MSEWKSYGHVYDMQLFNPIGKVESVTFDGEKAVAIIELALSEAGAAAAGEWAAMAISYIFDEPDVIEVYLPDGTVMMSIDGVRVK